MKPISILALACAAGITAGCQNSGPASSTPYAGKLAQKPYSSHDQITPDGDHLDGPIPGNHWPFTIDGGGGGGTVR